MGWLGWGVTAGHADGWGFLVCLKAEPTLTTARLLVVTGETHLGPAWAANNGCAGFLCKPVEPEVLLQEVQRCAA